VVDKFSSHILISREREAGQVHVLSQGGFFQVPDSNFHLRDSKAPMIGICVLKVVTCSTVSPLPSKVDIEGGLKFFGTSMLLIFVDRGWGSGSSTSSW